MTRANISAWAIRNPVPPIVMFAVLLFLGWTSFMNLPVTRFPNIDVPVVSVTVTQTAAAPAELETQVAKVVEDAVTNITGVKNVTSNITDGRSVTTIEFRLEVNTDRAVNDVKDAIARIRADLPRTVDEPVVERIEVESQAILAFAASSPTMTLEQLSWFVDDVVRRDLQGQRGVGRVSRFGGVNREIRVSLDPNRLLSLGITAGEVNRQLRSTSVDLAGGRGELGGLEQSIRTLAAARTIEELGDTKIVLSGGREIRLRDIASITDSFEEQRSFARLNGETPIVSFSIYRAKGASDVDVAKRVEARVKALAERNPNVTFSTIDNTVRYTYGNYKSAMHTLLEGAALAIIVVFIFLRDWRATIVTAIALPLSAIPAFWAMDMMGFSLNLVSLLAITLVTGILVDDAIVEIENIVRHMKMGKSPYRAAMEAADEIGLAVIAITLTIVAVFVPVSFMGGVPGQYFKQFGLVVAAAVIFSLLVARLITPMMAAFFMKEHAHKEPKDGVLMRAYTRFLAVTVRWRYLTLLVGIGLFTVSIWSTTLLPTGFIPPEDSSRFVISAELPPGATVEDNQRKTDQLARSIRDGVPEAESVFVIGGSNPTGTREVRRATIIVSLKPKDQRQRSQRQIMGQVAGLIGAVPDLRAWYVNDRGERDLAIVMLSSNPEALRQGVGQLEAEMRRLEGFANVAAVAGVDRPEIRIVPRLEEAARFGISTEAISDAIRVATIGDGAANLAKFNAGDRLIPIRVQMETTARADLDLLEALTVTSPSGAQIPLAALADVQFGVGPSSIERLNRERRVIVGADLTGGAVIGQGLDLVLASPAAQNLPAGVRIQRTGDAEIMEELFASFGKAMLLGLLMVFGVMVLLLGSVFQPITIMLSLPLSLGGVFLALLLTNNAVSMPVVIGILMLMGIVTKNAIMLVDFAVEEIKAGIPRAVAIVDAGRKRARPIIMTTIAMAAGMAPSAYGIGDGGEFRAPMAIAVIGGLVVSTVLSLVFVPSFFTVMDDLTRLTARLGRRFVNKVEDESTWTALPGAGGHAVGPALAVATPVAAGTAAAPANAPGHKLPPAAE
jgi:hydrophobic/amphiphilic exporter-1 (mainly G- bacteria), HAE1 family